jgi:hypothetical protein
MLMKSLIVAALAALAGCATTGMQGLVDFNSAFGQNIPASPQFKIEPVGRNRFQVVVYQGSALISERATRLAHLSKAAMIAMDDTCAKAGQELGAHQLNSDVDSFGYVNLGGFFSCSPRP